MRRWGWFGPLVVGMVATGNGPSAFADGISFLSQERSVAAVAGVAFGGPQDFDLSTDAAADFNVFDAFVFADASLPGVATVHAEASQFSELLPFEIRGHGTLGASALDGGVGGLDTAVADSAVFVTFLIDEAVPYSAEVNLQSEGTAGFGALSAGLRLLGPGGEVIDLVFSGGASSLLTTGVLLPGEYTLEAGAAFTALNAPSNQTSEFSGSYDFRLFVVPEPATLVLLTGGLLMLRRRR